LQLDGDSLQLDGDSLQLDGGSLQLDGDSLQLDGDSLQLDGDSLQLDEIILTTGTMMAMANMNDPKITMLIIYIMTLRIFMT